MCRKTEGKGRSLPTVTFFSWIGARKIFQINELRIIDHLTKGKTLIVIAHRLSTIMYADKILVLEDGAISAEGTHEQLLSSSQTYLDMWKAHISAMDWSMNKEAKILC